MSEPLLWDKNIVKCALCNTKIVWNGIGKIIKMHLDGAAHNKKLRSETVAEKRARSIAVKGLNFETKYYKHITRFFGNYTAVESTFRIFLDDGSSIIIVRFFSPGDAYKFLSLNSTWIIDGQYAEIVPDFYSGSDHFDKGNGEKSVSPKKVEKYNEFKNSPYSNERSAQPSGGGDSIYSSYQTQNDLRVAQSSSTITSQYQHSNVLNKDQYHGESLYSEGTARKNYDPDCYREGSDNSFTNKFVNEYRNVAIVSNEPESSKPLYSTNISNGTGYDDRANNYATSSDKTQLMKSLRQYEDATFGFSNNTVSPFHDSYEKTQSSNGHGSRNPQTQSKVARSGVQSSSTNSRYPERSERLGTRETDKSSKRVDRSRSPVRHFAGNDDRFIKESTDAKVLPRLDKKRNLPKIRSSILKGPFTSQIQELVTEVNCGVCRPSKVNDISYDVRQLLNREFQGAAVKPFGLMNLGIGIKGAPLELCIYLPNAVKSKLLQTKSLCVKYLDIIREMLKRNNSLFSNVLVLNDSVSFTYKPCNYEVRAGLLRDAMVLNDHLFHIYIKSDSRLTPIFVFLIFWAYSHDICEENVFEEHEMILLIIFYLQRLSKPIVPPGHMLQVDDGERHMDNKCLSYWHCTFKESFARNENDSDLLTLIEGFFLFYGDFTFKNIVISSFAGLSIPSQVFKTNAELPPEFKRYSYLVKNKYVYPLNTDSCICIQDPIKLNRNATITTTPKKLEYFQEKCLSASGLMYKFRMKHTDLGLVSALLNLSNKTTDHIHKITTAIFTRYPGRLNEDDTLLVFNRLNSLLDVTLRNILKAQFTVEKDINYSKKRNLMDGSVIYNCAQFYNLWSSRKVYKNKIPHHSSTLDWEAALSDKVMESVYQGLSTNTPMFEFMLKGHVRRNEKVIEVDIVFKDVEKDSVDGLTLFVGPIIDYELKRISIV